MRYEVGEMAGRVWTVLNTKGPSSLAQLKKHIGDSADLVNQGIGWLACEDKIEIEKKGNSVKISLK